MSKIKQCKITGQNFEVTDEDSAFYNKIGVPEPTLCPEERQRRRYAWRNERTLYRRDCDLCKKNMVTMYSPDSPYTVYCSTCWWSDAWDPTEYGRDFDFSRPFFEQFHEFQLAVPRVGLSSKNCINSEYVNHAGHSKNCYMSFVVWSSENCLYSNSVINGKYCVDCSRTEDGANELLYECLYCYGCYKCQFGFQLSDCSDCYYCFDCKNCQDCFLSYNLRGKSYCFMNEQLSKEEYREKVSQFNLGSYTSRSQLYPLWKDIIQKSALHRNLVIEQSIGCTGNFIYNSKNCTSCFEITNLEDCRYCTVATVAKDALDCSHFGTGTCELLYECHAAAGNYNTIVTHLSYDNAHISYCDTCHNCENMFGCISIKKGSYMIFNKKYPEEEYKILKNKIIKHMKQTGEYGEFFPAKFSPFGYNETQSQTYMPLSQAEAQKLGLEWQNNLPGTFNKETLQPEDLPDNIIDVTDTITKEILKCEKSGRNYNIVPAELQFYRQNNIPIPRLHPQERYLRRNMLRPERKLYDRTSKDGISVKTAYAPDRPERIVSEEYYKKEVL